MKYFFAIFLFFALSFSHARNLDNPDMIEETVVEVSDSSVIPVEVGVNRWDENKRGVLTSFYGGATLRGTSGSEIDGTVDMFRDSANLNASSTVAMGGAGSFRIGYRFNRVASLYSGFDLTAKGYRLKLASANNMTLYYQQGGAALEIPVLFRPIFPVFNRNKSFILLTGIAPSFLLNDKLTIYEDKSGLIRTSNRTEHVEQDLIGEPIELLNRDSTMAHSFEYEDFNRKVDMSLILSLGLETVLSKTVSYFWMCTYRHGLFNTKRITEEAVDKMEELGYETTTYTKKNRCVEFVIGFNFYTKKR